MLEFFNFSWGSHRRVIICTSKSSLKQINIVEGLWVFKFFFFFSIRLLFLKIYMEVCKHRKVGIKRKIRYWKWIQVCWPLNNMGVRGADPCTVENPYIATFGPCIYDSTSVDTPQIRSCSTVECISWKKSSHKWTCSIQTSFVQGSMIS